MMIGERKRSYTTIISLLLPCLLMTGACSSQGRESREVTAGELRDHIRYLSSDPLEGRLTGSEGDSLAAEYIRQQLAKAGLVPLSGDGFLRYSVTGEAVQGKNVFLTIAGKDFPSTGFMASSFSSDGELEAGVVFAGYGLNISNDSLKWNDYEGLDVTGKWVLILRGQAEPFPFHR